MAHIWDTWTQIGKYIADGSYKERYSIGDTALFPIMIDGISQGIVVQIAAFDEDILFDTGEKAPITWITKKVVAKYAMNPTPTSKGGWMLSDMRKHCMDLYNNILDDDAKTLIKPVRKTSYHYETKSSHTTKDLCWIPSMFEVYGEEYGGETGAKYTLLFNDSEACRKWDSDGRPAWWQLRSASVDFHNRFRYVYTDGGSSNNSAGNKISVAFGFCTAI